MITTPRPSFQIRGSRRSGVASLIEAPLYTLPADTTYETSTGRIRLDAYYITGNLSPAPADRFATATHTPTNGAELATALAASATANTIIELTAGTNYDSTGGFTVPAATSRTGWLIIRTGSLSGIPQGLDPSTSANRATSAHTASMGKIRVTGSGTSMLEFASNADRVWIEGVHFVMTASATNFTRMVGAGYTVAPASEADIPDQVGIVHCVFDAPVATTQCTRGIYHHFQRGFIALNAVYGFRRSGTQTQGIGAAGYCKKIDILGNYCEGLGQNYHLGGGDTKIGGVTYDPTDTRACWNHFYKDPAWKGVYTGEVGNIFELKKGIRTLVYGNILDGCWVDFQDGAAFKIKLSHQNNTTPEQQLKDTTIRGNLARNTAVLFSFVGAEPGGTTVNVGQSRTEFAYNLAYEINTTHTIASYQMGIISAGIVTATTPPSDLTIHHNTSIVGNATGFQLISLDPSPPATNKWNAVTIRDNIFQGYNGSNSIVKRGSTTQGIPSMDGCWEVGYVYTRNKHVGSTASPGSYPAGNAQVASITYVNAGARNYRIVAGQPGDGESLNGADLGYDGDLLDTETATVI